MKKNYKAGLSDAELKSKYQSTRQDGELEAEGKDNDGVEIEYKNPPITIGLAAYIKKLTEVVVGDNPRE